MAAGLSFVNPSRSVLFDLQRPFFYPVANSGAFNICKDIPPTGNKDHLDICLLASGDVRNVLYTTHQRRKLNDARKLKFYVNDVNSAIIAKDILLLSIAAQTPWKGIRTDISKHVDLFLSIWADLAISKENRKTLDLMLTQHLEEFTGTGAGAGESFMTVPERRHLWLIKRAWAKWLTTADTCESVLKFKADVADSLMQPWGVSEEQKIERKDDRTLEGISYAMDMTPFYPAKLEFYHYLDYGTMIRPGETGKGGRTELNPTMRDPETKQLPQVKSNPFVSYLSAAASADFVPETEHLYRTLFNTVKRLLVAFAKDVSKGMVSVHWDIGDCLDFLATRLDRTIKFNAIDTSNMMDYASLTALLAVTALRLDREDANSILWTETMKGQMAYDSVNDILDNSLWIPYPILPTVLQIKCQLPFESCLDFVSELGRYHRNTYLTGIKFKWNPILTAEHHPCKIDLSPKESLCVFKRMVDKMLKTLCQMHEQSVINYDEICSFYPHPLQYTVSTMMLTLLSASQLLKHPQDLFHHLYEKIRSDDRFKMLGFEVQNVARQMCPREWQPSEPLHSTFEQDSSTESSVYFAPLRTWLVHLHCSPFIGGIIVKELTSKDCSVIESGKKARKGSQSDLRKWMGRNLDRVQIIDSYKIFYPYDEVEICLPTALIHPKSPHTLLLFALETGLLVFEPVKLSDLSMRLTSRDENRLLPILPTSQKQDCPQSIGSGGLKVTQVQETMKNFSVVLLSKLPSDAVVNIAPGNGSCEIAFAFGSPANSKPLLMSLPNCVQVQRKVLDKWKRCSTKDGQSTVVTISKSDGAHKPDQELLDLDGLEKWPIFRPFDPQQGMFTILEQAVSEKLLFVGHDYYHDARRTLANMYIAFIDRQLGDNGCKIFRFISSLEIGIAGHARRVLTSTRGIPIIEFFFMVANQDLTSDLREVNRFVAYTQEEKNKKIDNSKVPNEAVNFLLQQLEKNLKRQVKPVSRDFGGVSLRRSFFIPIYSTENKVGTRRPATGVSAFERELMQHPTYRPHPDVGRLHPELMKKCFTCSAIVRLKVCSRCKKEWFCSKECQQKGWMQHKRHCHPHK